MPHLLAMSFEGQLAPSFELACLAPPHPAPDGWGVGFYPGGEPSATVLKESAPPPESPRSRLVESWQNLQASLFVLHIRRATWGSPSEANTQPFARAWGRRDWLFAHAGSLRARPELDPHATFEPVGSTDTELIFCDLMNRFAEAGWQSVGDLDLASVHGWLRSLNALGPLTAVLTDGRDLVGYVDGEGKVPLHLCEVRPPYGQLSLSDADVTADLTRRGVRSHRGVVLATAELAVAGDAAARWEALAPGDLVVVRHGVVRSRAAGAARAERAPGWVSGRALLRPERSEVRTFAISHRTVYRYAHPVERSMHLLRVTPAHDRLQSVRRHQIAVSVDGAWRDYEDVFGNQVRRLLIDVPFTELVVEASSEVELLDTDPLSYRPLHARTSFPLVFMPWHEQVLRPYLLPGELPESELTELAEYAMSFVERNDADLLDTLVDLNQTIYRDYQYAPNTTTVTTSPYDVYVSRRGVCQDFTNLFICLARLLGIPARYVCGYVHAAELADSRQAQASHAWAQVYLPEAGWKGFDPTNGLLTQTDHIRVAVGRSYRDATPTSGVIYVGGGGETLEVEVRVTPA
jgi:transglutaminase-like putative cysteine protease/predicted glutamine amidotransferase